MRNKSRTLTVKTGSLCDQTECFINFPDGTRQSITPGVLVVIPKGQYYQQEAPSHTGYVFLGSRAETYSNSRFGPEGQIKAGDELAAVGGLLDLLLGRISHHLGMSEFRQCRGAPSTRDVSSCGYLTRIKNIPALCVNNKHRRKTSAGSSEVSGLALVKTRCD